VTSARNTYNTAVNNQTSSLSKDQQSIANAEQSLATAIANQASTVASNDVKRAPATADTVASDQQSLASAQQQLATAQKNLDDTVLKAPVAGTVATISQQVGDVATSGGTTGFVALTDLTVLQVKVGLAEADAARVKVDQDAKISLDADATKSFTGKVRSVDTTGTSVSNVMTYYAIVNLVGNTDGVKPGMSASVDITVGSKTGVLTLPVAAVSGTGSNATVTVTTDSGNQPKQIGVGLRGDDTVEITSGLTAGDKVIVASASTATANAGGFPTGGPPAGVGALGGGIGR
jgi:macrolide-specific efflux system membrane fusion protein